MKQVFIAVYIALKFSQSGSVNQYGTLPFPLHILRAQTEHFHGRNDKNLLVTHTAGFGLDGFPLL
jgi:hypothetical protein